jgi:hypothetical protein
MILIMFSILSVFIKNIYILVYLKKCSLLFTLTQFMFTVFTFHEKKVIGTLKLGMIIYHINYKSEWILPTYVIYEGIRCKSSCIDL